MEQNAPYTNREIDNFFIRLDDRMTNRDTTLEKRMTNQDDHLTEILNQTRKTNGRVTKIELWRSYMMGAMAVIVALGVPILLLLIKMYLADKA